MRINGAGDQSQPLDGIIVHGSIPKTPSQSCRNCSKIRDCSILQYALSNMEAIGLIPSAPGVLAEAYDIPFPMPCRGESWQAKPNRTFDSNPLVQRLGLGDVGEPAPEI